MPQEKAELKTTIDPEGKKKQMTSARTMLVREITCFFYPSDGTLVQSPTSPNLEVFKEKARGGT